MESHARQRLLYAVTVRPKSLYEDVHAPTGHSGCDGTNRTLLELTTQTKTQQLPEESVKVAHLVVLISFLLISTMLNQVSHTTLVNIFVVDAFTHHSVGTLGFVYVHLFTDLASRQVNPVFTKSKLVTELIACMALLFHSHPEWKPNGSAVDRKIKIDMEAGYQSAEFAEYCHSLSYRSEERRVGKECRP